MMIVAASASRRRWWSRAPSPRDGRSRWSASLQGSSSCKPVAPSSSARARSTRPRWRRPLGQVTEHGRRRKSPPWDHIAAEIELAPAFFAAPGRRPCRFCQGAGVRQAVMAKPGAGLSSQQRPYRLRHVTNSDVVAPGDTLTVRLAARRSIRGAGPVGPGRWSATAAGRAGPGCSAAATRCCGPAGSTKDVTISSGGTLTLAGDSCGWRCPVGWDCVDRPEPQRRPPALRREISLLKCCAWGVTQRRSAFGSAIDTTVQTAETRSFPPTLAGRHAGFEAAAGNLVVGGIDLGGTISRGGALVLAGERIETSVTLSASTMSDTEVVSGATLLSAANLDLLSAGRRRIGGDRRSASRSMRWCWLAATKSSAPATPRGRTRSGWRRRRRSVEVGVEVGGTVSSGGTLVLAGLLRRFGQDPFFSSAPSTAGDYRRHCSRARSTSWTRWSLRAEWRSLTAEAAADMSVLRVSLGAGRFGRPHVQLCFPGGVLVVSAGGGARDDDRRRRPWQP